MSIEGEEPTPTEWVDASGAGGDAPIPAESESPTPESESPTPESESPTPEPLEPAIPEAVAEPADAAEAETPEAETPEAAPSSDEAQEAPLDEADWEPEPAPAPTVRTSRSLAAFLSFLIPGTGQFLSGRIAAGFFFLLPILFVAVIGLILASGNLGEAVGFMLQPTVLLGIFVTDVVLFAWRATAIIDAWWNVPADVPRSPLSAAFLAVLLLITGASHAVVGAQVLAVRDTVDTVFASDGGDDGFGDVAAPTPAPTAAPTPADASHAVIPTIPPTTKPTPSPTPRPGPLTDGRLDLLLVGADAGPGRWSLRTDTMIVLSVDVASGEAALFSIPRNMVNVPLPAESRRAFACGCYPQLLNSLYVYAQAHPRQFPGNDDVRGLRAVQMAIGNLVGRQLDGMVLVKLQGFVALVNAVGGIDVNVPRSIYDSHYPLETGTGDVAIYIRAGKQHMNGRKALMYARSRHQDSDYGRMSRQQIVISAIGKKLLKGDLVAKLPKLLKVAKQNLWTNLRTSDLPDLASLAEATDLKGIQTYRFVPPTYAEYLDKRSIKAIRQLVAHVFDKAKPAATPRPTPTPTLRNPFGSG